MQLEEWVTARSRGTGEPSPGDRRYGVAHELMRAARLMSDSHHSALPPVILLALSSSSKFIMLSMTTCIQRSVNQSVNFQRGFVCMH